MGGLGFGLKWDMGWMHDTLEYFANDPVHRRYHHDELTFRALYAFTENFVLPLSHDEVVHGKGSLLAKMPGDDWQKFANLRLLYGYMYAQPGQEAAVHGRRVRPVREWNHDASLDWHLLDEAPHARVAALRGRSQPRCTASEPALHELDFDASRLRVDRCDDRENSVLQLPAAQPQRRHVLCVVQLHAGAAVELPDRRAARRAAGARS